METGFMILIDICVVCFDLLLFMNAITLKKDSRSTRMIMYCGSGIIVTAYFLATYIFKWTPSLASTVFMSIPSLILFFLLSKYKDARFFLTFCFVDSCSLIVAFWGRYLSVLIGGAVGSAVAFAATFLACLGIFWVSRPYFRRYAKLLEYAQAGWRAMMICSVLIYFALIFFAAYPKPLLERMEYVPVYFLFSLVVASCYVVFVSSALKTSQIYEQSQQLLREKQWHRVAFEDGLTGVGNRTAYMEEINRLERELTEGDQICLIELDMDGFKQINDTMGHYKGDLVLKEMAKAIGEVFVSPESSVFRIGGDEFVVITKGVSKERVETLIGQLRRKIDQQPERELFQFSTGYSFVRQEDENAVEQAFTRADENMYLDKNARRTERG